MATESAGVETNHAARVSLADGRSVDLSGKINSKDEAKGSVLEE